MVVGFIPTLGDFEVVDTNGAMVQAGLPPYQRFFITYVPWYLTVSAYLKMQAWTAYGGEQPAQQRSRVRINGNEIGIIPPQGQGTDALPENFIEFVLPFRGAALNQNPFQANVLEITPPIQAPPPAVTNPFIVVKNVICHYKRIGPQ